MAAWPGHGASFFRQPTASHRQRTVAACRSCTSTADWTAASHFWCGTIGSARISMCAPAIYRARPRSRRCRRPSLSTSAHSTASPCAASTSSVPSDVPPLRDKLHAAEVETFEADVRFASRYLIERGIKGGCEIEGNPRSGAGGLRVRQSATAPGRGADRAARAVLRHRDGCEGRASAGDIAVRPGQR